MAKQRGLHQILGKYNDTCYFERKGTRGGLLRRINSGMSERVKLGEEYANLRAVNTLFGACSLYASIIFNFFSSRALFLFKKNRQSELTRRLFLYRNGRFISSNKLSVGFGVYETYTLSFLFDSVVRNKFYDVFSGFPRQIIGPDYNASVVLTLSSIDLERYCDKYNATGCYIGVVGPCYIYPLLRASIYDKFVIEDYGVKNQRYGWSWVKGDGDLEISINVGDTDDTAVFGFIYAIPELEQPEGLPIRLLTGSCCGLYQIIIGE